MRIRNSFRPTLHWRAALLCLLMPALLAAAAACGGDGDDDPGDGGGDATPIPTATPFARVPDPIIVSGPPPSASSEGTTYVVQGGDTLSAIAEQFETSVEAILELNGLTDPSLVFVGQELAIPSAQPASVATNGGSTGSDTGADDGADNGDTPATSDAPGSNVYVVVPGDTALGIAFAFDVTLEELAAANGVSVDDLSSLDAGDELVLPQS